MLKVHFKAQDKKFNEYLAVCEKLGKDWSALDTLLKVHKVEDKSTVIFFIKAIDNINANSINERLGEERKKQERKSQGKDNMNFPKGK